MSIKRGIIQSRGLGDIIIALPIARHYFDRGDEIVWPVCEEFYSSVKDHVKWVNWVSIPTDPEGRYFLETPLSVFKDWGVDPDEALYLYQFLNTVPELTDPEISNCLRIITDNFFKATYIEFDLLGYPCHFFFIADKNGFNISHLPAPLHR